MPWPSLENYLKKVTHRLQTQTLQTSKSSVWCKRNHSFHHSSFPPACLEMWCKGSLILGTLATQIRKSLSKQTSEKSLKNICHKTYILCEKVVVPFGFPGPFFKVFLTRIPLGHQSPQKVRKRSLKGHQKSYKIERKLETRNRNSENYWSVLANAIQLHLMFRIGFSQNPARRNARSALNNPI